MEYITINTHYFLTILKALYLNTQIRYIHIIIQILFNFQSSVITIT